MTGWMSGWSTSPFMRGWIDGDLDRIDGRVCGFMGTDSGCVVVWMDRWMNKQIVGWMDVWINGWMVG